MKKIIVSSFALLIISTLLLSSCGPATATPTPFFWAVDELTATAGAPVDDGPIQAMVVEATPIKAIVNDPTPIQGVVNDEPVQAIVTTATPVIGLLNPSVQHQRVCLYDSTNAWFLKNDAASEVTVTWKYDYLNPSRTDAEGQVSLPAKSGFVKVYTSPNKGAFIIPKILNVNSTTCFAVVAPNPESSDAPASAPTACSPTAPGCTP